MERMIRRKGRKLFERNVLLLLVGSRRNKCTNVVASIWDIAVNLLTLEKIASTLKLTKQKG